MSWFKDAIAKRLAPEMHRRAERYDRLISDLCYEVHWFAFDFPNVADAYRRLIANDYNYWRPLAVKPIGSLPSDISAFREFLRGRKSPPSPTEEEGK
jgi:hypothetical protein